MGCSSLEKLDLSDFTVSTDSVASMFRETALKEITLGEKFKKITKNMMLANDGWANINSPDISVGGDSEYAEFSNNGKNTYIVTGVISTSIKGDTNGDGIVNDDDIDVLEKWIMGDSDVILNNMSSIDLNEDNCVDVFDIVHLRGLLND